MDEKLDDASEDEQDELLGEREDSKVQESPVSCPKGCVGVEDYKRLAADFENYRRHVENISKDSRAAGKAAVIADLLPILDDFDSAIKHYEANEEVKSGLLGLQKRFFDALKSQGLEEIDGCEGERFDPGIHEAVRTDENVEEGLVCKQLRKGYSFDGIVLRHPMVVVGSAKAKEGKKEDNKEAAKDGGNKK
ncbi:MAG: nucleotide exchange factor GrpE [Candidatus Omnitrophica bacterium]|nr:nucleotide exchange factor GrpE [Candidatus Omnitrophota bacterium]